VEGPVSGDTVTAELQLCNYYTMCRRNDVLAATKSHKGSRKLKRKIVFILLKC